MWSILFQRATLMVMLVLRGIQGMTAPTWRKLVYDRRLFSFQQSKWLSCTKELAYGCLYLSMRYKKCSHSFRPSTCRKSCTINRGVLIKISLLSAKHARSSEVRRVGEAGRFEKHMVLTTSLKGVLLVVHTRPPRENLSGNSLPCVWNTITDIRSTSIAGRTAYGWRWGFSPCNSNPKS